MSVVGIDIGDHSTCIAVAGQGGVETITNDYTQRNTPTVIALGGRQRFMGVSAENQRNLNDKNTVSYFKNFLGRSYKEEYVQNQLSEIGADVIEFEDGSVGFNIMNKTYRPEQVLAMMFTKVKDIVRNYQGKEITTCTVSVPNHFTNTQIRAVHDAAKISGLCSVKILNDTSALAIAYGRTKKDLPSGEDASRNVVFVDCGSGSLQASIVRISKEKAVVLGSSSSTSTGGKFFNKALLEYFATEIERKYKCNIRKNSKSLNKLRVAVEKIKKQMSANSNKLPFQIDSLVDDIDVSLSVDRDTFEGLIDNQLEEIKKTCIKLLSSTTITKEEIHSVEVVGGSTRIPAVKKIIEEVFGIPPSTSLNADEGVAKGCCLQSAAISDKFLTKSFEIEECDDDVKRGHFDAQSPGLGQNMLTKYFELEDQMIEDDNKEIARQEAKNILEGELYKYRDLVNEKSNGIEEEEAFKDMKTYFEETEEWLYEEGENASEITYNAMLSSLHDKCDTFQLWETKLRKVREIEEEKKRNLEQRLQKSSRNEDPMPKQIPDTGEDEEMYPRRMHRKHMENRCHSSPKNKLHSRPTSGFTRGNYGRSQMFEEPFGFGPSPFYQRTLFGW